MIEFAKILGETEGHRTRVQFRTGETLLVPISIMGTNVSVPSAKWLSTNKDKFLAVIDFEKNIRESPILVGFYPVKGASSKEYNTHERLIYIVEKLVNQLSKAKTNTQLGPQQFMPDTLVVLDDIKEAISSLKDDIEEVKL